MLYEFAIPNYESCNYHFEQFPSFLSDDEIGRIITIGDSLDSTNVKLYGKFDDSHVKASGSHFLLNNDTAWVYDKMAALSIQFNEEIFKYDLSGFFENFYYLRYTAGEHFNWHIDMGDTPAPRKMSMVLQLSDPSEYDGGEFDLMITQNHARTKKGKGLITVFPSYKIHRVTPVTKGIRRTLTMFCAGPNFR